MSEHIRSLTRCPACHTDCGKISFARCGSSEFNLFPVKICEARLFFLSSEQLPWAPRCLDALFSQKQHKGRQWSYANMIIVISIIINPLQWTVTGQSELGTSQISLICQSEQTDLKQMAVRDEGVKCFRQAFRGGTFKGIWGSSVLSLCSFHPGQEEGLDGCVEWWVPLREAATWSGYSQPLH